MVDLGEVGAGAEREGRRRLEELHAEAFHPFSPIVGLGAVDGLPGALEVDLIDGKLADSGVGGYDGFAAREDDTASAKRVSVGSSFEVTRNLRLSKCQVLRQRLAVEEFGDERLVLRVDNSVANETLRTTGDQHLWRKTDNLDTPC